jgi:hypothetical protein
MKQAVRLFLVAWTLGLAGYAGSHTSSPAGLGITRLEIVQRKIVFGGASFGSAGQYELLTGTAHGELDPNAEGNVGIVNLSNAPLDAKGHVEYGMDIVILKPTDMAKGNGTLVYDVVNRGTERALAQLNQSGSTFVGNDAGTAFLMKHGYSVAWSGWQGDLPGNSNLIKGNFPIASRDGKPIVGPGREEFTDIPAVPKFTERLTFPAATLDPSAATLTVREHEADHRQLVSQSSWSYVDANIVQIMAVPDFDRGAIYELLYPATNPVVMGIGFAATRDFVSFLRYAQQDSTGAPNPLQQLGTVFKATLGFGVSQSGRFLKDFVYQGFNIDIADRIVFDGILPINSGARVTFTNYQFGQPGRFSRQHEDHQYPGDQFPFSYATSTDALSGKTDGLLAKCTKSRTCPRIIHADSDTEPWQARASLVVTDTGGHPLALPGNVRAYMFSGIPHVSADTPVRGECQKSQNTLAYSPYARALLVALGRWVTAGVAPPPSRYPNLKDRTLVTIAQAQALYPRIPGAPFSPVISKLRRIDPNRMPPSASGPEYPLFVPRTNADGNPTGGIEPPEITVPIATYSGRSFRGPGFAEGELCGVYGEYIPFPGTRNERLASGDSRYSLEERYAGQQDYVNKRRAAVDALVQQGFVLSEDAAALASGALPVAASAKP